MSTDKIILDSDDWLVNYFIDHERYKKRTRKKKIIIQDMNIFSGEAAKVYDPEYIANGWLRTKIPGCSHTALLENNLIEDPYIGRNIDKISWVEKYSWWFRKEFEIPADWKGNKIVIEFKCVDYSADFYLNGKKIGSHADAFMPAKFDITKNVLAGKKNLLCVCIQPPPDASPNHYRLKNADFAKHHRCQMSWGWDWSRRLVPQGIMDSVIVSSWKDFSIDDLRVKTEKISNSDDFNVLLNMEISSSKSRALSAAANIIPADGNKSKKTQEFKIDVKKGNNIVSFSVTYKNPSLWYPNGYGEQPLYKLKLSITSADGETHLKEISFGFRELEMLRNPGCPDESYPLTFSINKKKIFARGANWVPADMIFPRADKVVYKRLIKLAAEAGFNMLRIWGGGIIEKDDFYSLCDEYGILVWQEFPHACSSYPKTRSYLDQKKKEAVSIIKRLRNHVSLALWCGANEVMYYGETAKSPLLNLYKKLVKDLNPEIDYHLSSPDKSREGERHHGPWCYEKHSFYNEHFRYFASEIGCNGMPELESLQKFIPEKDIFPMGEVYDYHFAFRHGSKTLNTAPFAVSNIQEYSRASQAAQADTLKYIMGHYRRAFPKSSGCLIWQFNESWPTCAWSIVDFYLRPKMAYYWLKKACEKISVSIRDDGWILSNEKLNAELIAVSDMDSNLDAVAANVELFSLDGRLLFSSKYKFNLQKGVLSKIANIKVVTKNVSCPAVLFVELFSNGKLLHRNEFLYFSRESGNSFEKDSEISMRTTLKNGNIEVNLINDSAKVLAGVRVEIPGIDCAELYYSDNYFHMKPGEKRTIVIHPECVIKKIPDIKVSAWNLT